MYKQWLLKLCSIIVVASFFMIGCGKEQLIPGSETLIEGPKELPEWVNKPSIKNTDKVKAFVGVSLNNATEKMAKDYAETDVKNRILDGMWGAYGERKIRETFSNAGLTTPIIDDGTTRQVQSEWKSKGYIKYDVAEYCTRKLQRIDETRAAKSFYNVYALCLVNREMVKQFLEDVLKVQKAKETSEQAQKNIDKAVELIDKMSGKDFQDW